MRNCLIIAAGLISMICQGQVAVVGQWKTIDDETGKERSVVELYERQGMLFGKVIKIFPSPGEDPDPTFTECDRDDHRFNKKIIGMEIVQKMRKVGTEYTEGNILDPENGKIYRCRLWIEDGNLKVRGYWGPFFRTQTWLRVR